jgi:hypothetical protein
MKNTIYANRLGLIPSTEVAFRLRLDAERKRRAEEERREREARARVRSARRREFWARVRGGLAGLTGTRPASAA